MTLIATPGLYLPPKMPVFFGTSPALATGANMTGSTSAIEYVFQVPKSGTLAKFHFLVSTFTTGDDVKVSFRNVSLSTGNEDGAIDQYRVLTVSSAGWKTTGLVTSNGTDGGTKRSVTKGDYLAVVVEFNSFVAGNFVIGIAQYDSGGNGGSAMSSAYTKRFALGGWNDPNLRALSCMALEYDDGSLGEMESIQCLPALTFTSNSLNSGSTPDEVALRFKAPLDCAVDGCWVYGNNGGFDLDMVLYDTDGTTVLASGSFDGTIRDVTGIVMKFLRFSSAATLVKDGVYRLAMKPTTTSAVTVWSYEVSSNAIFGACALGIDGYWSERTDAGSWTDTTTKRPFMGLHVSQVDDGAGSGASGSFGFVG